MSSVRRIALIGFLAFSAPVGSGVAEADGARVPVVAELFSSEGCSSCPPADALLARLDRDQPIAGVDVVALEMHVDYWNQLVLAVTERGLSTRVTAGESSGETLAHGPVVRTLRAVGELGPSGLHANVTEPPKPGARVVVFVEARDSLHVLGAAAL